MVAIFSYFVCDSKTPAARTIFPSGAADLVCNRAGRGPLPHACRLLRSFGLNRKRPWPLAALGRRSHIVDSTLMRPMCSRAGPFERVNAPVLLSRMLDHIDRHSDDPGLSAATLARQFQLPERYVHKLFFRRQAAGWRARHHSGFSSAPPICSAIPNRTIAESRSLRAFRDISHFNRLFKRSNGASPASFVSTMTSSTGLNHGCRSPGAHRPRNRGAVSETFLRPIHSVF